MATAAPVRPIRNEAAQGTRIPRGGGDDLMRRGSTCVASATRGGSRGQFTPIAAVGYLRPDDRRRDGGRAGCRGRGWAIPGAPAKRTVGIGANKPAATVSVRALSRADQPPRGASPHRDRRSASTTAADAGFACAPGGCPADGATQRVAVAHSPTEPRAISLVLSRRLRERRRRQLRWPTGTAQLIAIAPCGAVRCGRREVSPEPPG
jgi:hypothetical protein